MNYCLQTIASLLLLSLLGKTLSAGLPQRIQYFQKSSEESQANLQQFSRTVRSSAKCFENSFNQTISVVYGDDVNITCGCSKTAQDKVKWFDGNCEEMTSLPSRMSLVDDDQILSIKNYSDENFKSYKCEMVNVGTVTACAYYIRLDATEVIPAPSSATAILTVILLAALSVGLLCLIRNYKARISLCFRDSCRPSNSNDGKIYDAYVSMGVSGPDNKFVDSFVTDILMKKYGYNLLVDDQNILPRLDYSERLHANLKKSRRLLVVFSPSYMTHDWCMYCFNEGLRKLIDLSTPMIFVITDHTILTELRTHADLIAHVPQILLTAYQSSGERNHSIERVRQRLPPPSKAFRMSRNNGMRSPMLSDAESIHQSDFNIDSNGNRNTYGLIHNQQNGTEYTFKTPEKITDDVTMEYDEPQGPDDYVTAVEAGQTIDPNQVKVHQYSARKDFYNLTVADT